MSDQNTVKHGDGFLDDVENLPKHVQEKLIHLLVIVAENVFDPRLHTKPLGPPLKGKFSFRITRDWRVGFKFLGDHQIFLLVADHRDQIYARMKRL